MTFQALTIPSAIKPRTPACSTVKKPCSSVSVNSAMRKNRKSLTYQNSFSSFQYARTAKQTMTAKMTYDMTDLLSDVKSFLNFAASLAIKSHATLRRYANVVYQNKMETTMSRPTGYRMDMGKRLAKYISPEPNSGCWLWTGSDDGKRGYGRIQNSDGSKQAHRVSYEHYKGAKIPADMEIDHLCKNPSCVNPDHLEVVTQEENMRRAPKHGLKLGGAANGERQKAKTHCPLGHEYTPENTGPNGPNGRACRKCRAMKEAKRRERLRISSKSLV